MPFILGVRCWLLLSMLKSSYASNGCCFVIRFAWRKKNNHFIRFVPLAFFFSPIVICKLLAYINQNYTACNLIIFNYIRCVSKSFWISSNHGIFIEFDNIFIVVLVRFSYMSIVFRVHCVHFIVNLVCWNMVSFEIYTFFILSISST